MLNADGSVTIRHHNGKEINVRKYVDLLNHSDVGACVMISDPLTLKLPHDHCGANPGSYDLTDPNSYKMECNRMVIVMCLSKWELHVVPLYNLRLFERCGTSYILFDHTSVERTMANSREITMKSWCRDRGPEDERITE